MESGDRGMNKALSGRSPRSEDYLEAVYHLIKDKGYASTTDISSRLDVRPPTVTSMIEKLSTQGYITHQRYRGMQLTELGRKAALSVIRRHKVISELLSMIGVEDEVAYEDTEGIEHHVQLNTIQRMEGLAEFLRLNPKTLRLIRKFIDSR